ncbi:hypothetical protein ACRV7V_004053, partial [Escherichia coli]
MIYSNFGFESFYFKSAFAARISAFFAEYSHSSAILNSIAEVRTQWGIEFAHSRYCSANILS